MSPTLRTRTAIERDEELIGDIVDLLHIQHWRQESASTLLRPEEALRSAWNIFTTEQRILAESGE